MSDQPSGWIRLTLQGNALSSGLTPPRVRVNGYPVATKRGENLLPVWAGRTHLDVDLQWMWVYGQAALDVDVAEGQTVPVWYAPPYFTWSRGGIGTEPQRRPDRVAFWLVLAAVVLLVVLGAVAATLTG